MICGQSGKPESKCRSIPTGVDPKRIRVDEEASHRFRVKLGVSQDDFLVGTACFIRSWKGIADFLKAADLLRGLKEIKWVIIGGGHEKEYRQMAKEWKLEGIVHFTGHLDDPFPALGALDLFTLLSTANEGVSQAILQAAYLGKPLVSTSVGGLGEVCLDRQTGIQVAPFSPDQVARAVLELKENPPLRELLGQKGKRLVEEQFTFPRTIDQMEEVNEVAIKSAFLYNFKFMEQDLPVLKFSIFDRFLDRRWISATASFLAGAAVLVFYLQSGPKAPDFVQAEALVAKWISLPDDSLVFREMSKALKKVPALQQKYEPIIAQKLMEGGRGAEALEIASRAIGLARAEVPYHAHFAETSLLIEQGKYQIALERAAELKERMVRECDIEAFWGDRLVGGALLFAHNLLRIACLQQELNNRPGELAAWEELERLLNTKEESPTSHLLLSSFREKGLDLSHYILERKSLLYRS